MKGRQNERVRSFFEQELRYNPLKTGTNCKRREKQFENIHLNEEPLFDKEYNIEITDVLLRFLRKRE